MPVVRMRQSMLRLPEPEVSELSATLKVLSDKNRLRIMALLMRGELCVCEIFTALELPQNLISHHLAVLRQEGLLNDRHDPHDARVIYYSVDPQVVNELRAKLLSFLDLSQLDPSPAQCVYGETDEKQPSSGGTHKKGEITTHDR